MISKNRPTRGKIGTPYHIERISQGKKSCASCIYYEKEDSSCSIKPIVLSEVGFNYYKQCKDFEIKQSQNNKDIIGKDVNKRIARVVSQSFSNGGDLKIVAKSFNISLYKTLVIYNDIYEEFKVMDQKNIYKLRSCGLSNKKIAKFYNVNEEAILNKLKSNSNPIKETNKNTCKLKVNKVTENSIIVRNASEGCCNLCNKKDRHISIYYIDENRNESIDSVLNMVVLCKQCIREVNKNKDEYHDKLKEIAIERLEKITELV